MSGTAPRVEFTPAEIRTVMLGLMLALFLASLDQTIVATALSRIAQDLGGWELMPWVVTAYLIASTVTTPIYGRLSDLYGRRPVLLVSVSIFVFGAVLCALSPSMLALIAARLVQGIGGGGLRSIALAVVGDMLPPRERGRYQGYLSSVFATANVSGPVLGGLFADYLSWHWIFWIDVPLGAAAFAMTWTQLKRLPLPGKDPKIDWLGAVLIVASATPLLLAITAVQRSGNWASPEALGWCIAGLVALAGLVLQERAAPEPMLPPRLFASREFVLLGLVTLLSSMAMMALVILIPLHYQLVGGLSANQAGLRMIAMTLGTVTGSFIAGQLVTKFGRYRYLPILGMTMAAIACAVLSQRELGSSLLLDVVVTCSLGLSFGGQLSPMTVAIQNALEPRDGGIGVSCMMFFRLMGGAFGVAALSAILIGQVTAGTLALPGHEVLGDQPGLTLLMADRRATIPPALLPGLTAALRAAFAQVYLVAAAILVLGIVIALMLKELPLRGRE